MEFSDRGALEAQKLHLRHALKEWEAAFHSQHGRKAGRDDIKADSTIAARYKEYQKVQDVLSGKQPTTASKAAKKQKRSRPETSLPESPSKRRRSLHDTPQKQAPAIPISLSDQEDQEDQDRDPNTPAIKRTFIGPTPQKDGIVLGLFDLLPVAQTPSNRNRSVLGELDRNVAIVTPSKPLNASLQEAACQYEERARGSRTPASTGKRFMLDQFMTPQKKESKGQTRAEDGEENGKELTTPSSSFRQFLTPAFLRRDNFVMATIDEAPTSPQAAQPWKRRSFGRSLSGMIQDMRREAEKDADEELDLLREMEDEAEGISRPKSVVTSLPPPKIVVEDSQAALPAMANGLDRDGFVPSDVEQSGSEEEQQDNGNPPRKPWKKKGLKRQTRRVNMRPVAKKAQPQKSIALENNEEEDNVVDETQIPDEDIPSDIERGSDEEYGEERITTKPKEKPRSQAKAKKETNKESEAKRKNVRKVKPEAHANYRALKIKNKNSKANGRGRFGRRR